MHWYLDHYYGTDEDLGFAGTFTDPARVGAFAVSDAALRAHEPDALFRLLVATACFQRLRDSLVQRILTGLTAAQVAELTSAEALRMKAAASTCPHLASTTALRERCDLTKRQGLGVCEAEPGLPCHLKSHTVWLKRYGHFGKMPTSLALVLLEAGVSDLAELYRRIRAESASREAAADALVAALSRGWRVNDKIAHMFLSTLTNPAYWGGQAPWQEGVAWERFVVVDVNVDRYLAAIGYSGPTTYAARADFVRSVAARINLSRHQPGLAAYNPRLVQQAMYVFMGASNRRLAVRDCWRGGPTTCRSCRAELRSMCPMRQA